MRERALATPDAAAKVVPGAFESVVNAKWSHVLSDVADKPLGIRVVNGLPENAWSDAEVNRTPLQLPTENVDEERDDGLELLVLTSEKGWPFTLFGTHATDVVVRRESVRVWNIMKADLDAWLVRKEGCPRPSILLGSPGIGKSFGVGSHLLYELLHYAPGKLDAVAFLVHGEMYIFYFPRGGVPGRVERYTKDDGAWRIFTLSRAGCRGYMILDAKETMDLPICLPTRLWGSIVLSSPNERNYKVWDETNRGTRFLYINRYHTREMKAYFAWLRRADLAIAEGNAAVRTELEESWRVMEGRMREVGQAPRYVFDEESYQSRKDEVEWTLNTLIAGKASYFLLVLRGKVDWKYDIAAHSLLDLVRLKSGAIERCGDRPVSVAVRSKMIERLRDIVASDPRLFEPYYNKRDVFEILVLAALQRPASARHLLQGVRILQGGACMQKESAVETIVVPRLANKRHTFRHVELLYDMLEPEEATACEPMVLYRSCNAYDPVISAFFVVEDHSDQTGRAGLQHGAPQRTVVLLQVTLAKERHTDTNMLMSLKKALRAQFSNWEDFTRDAQWEVIYFQADKTDKMSTSQRCTISSGMDRDADHVNAYEFWDTKVRQYHR
ncbi:putative retrotransposon hot spot protein 4 (RHS4) [Trypanosoma vivax]|nr:putative retrotransposon hot spot protein 4 (RHS4) [Trypanosoma vivax]